MFSFVVQLCVCVCVCVCVAWGLGGELREDRTCKPSLSALGQALSSAPGGMYGSKHFSVFSLSLLTCMYLCKHLEHVLCYFFIAFG